MSSSGPAGSGLPAWKRALLERKRAKLAAGVELERGRAAADGGEPPAAGPGPSEGGERLVVAESLGPLRENPFMRLEGERRRRRPRLAPAPAADPPALARLLELYGAVPGIRTIRADNILIIESREPQAGSTPTPPASPPPPDPLRRLLARSGSALTEIRAAEVVIYEPEPPKAPAGDAEAGRVSRLLQKFDRRPPRTHAVRGRWRGGGGATPQPAVPNPSPEGAPAPQESPPLPTSTAQPCGLQPGGFVQKTGSNSFVVNPRGCRPTPAASRHVPPVLSNGPVEPAVGNRSPVSPKPVPSPSPAAASPTQANVGKPKPKEAVESLPPPQPSAIPDSSATASLSRPTPLLSSNCSFEIRPAPKPDLAAIPAHDLQAQALASLRLNSRNSFLFVPRRKGDATGLPDVTDSPPTLPGGALPSEKPAETLVPVTYIDEDLLELEAGHLPPLRVLSPRLEGFDVLQESNSALEMEESVLSAYRPLPTGAAAVSQKGSNTFTIVPKRKPPSAGLETFSRIQLLEEEEEEEEENRAKAKTDAPHQELGQLLKKRYPTVNEIEVIGGYLSLDKSCMSKSGSRRKKMKISFNETSLQTMFEYPSESSLVEEEGEEEEYATEVDEVPSSLALHLDATNSGLSSYTPKHSIEFSKWQEQQYEEMPPHTGTFPRDADLPGSQVMLTPADKSSLADFSSEPALYF
ncbi:taperin [Tiliqua scincoides]|uniref:taperin n=1 Tax=Tiliqua scincoides TaxID=71010 RepID=UPI0034622F26